MGGQLGVRFLKVTIISCCAEMLISNTESKHNLSIIWANINMKYLVHKSVSYTKFIFDSTLF
ncbi:hypothetical protein BpHYR1_021445 [Brachionus plicatilis]|uniref:Uncharacterized protein n=1 Tax=Brachionus plicatilis TaxID=10195 RepID=A0A3M7SUW3_BRAPC|nr:hypothetical protein BpHYR1_021445 [Brachionus plicatilis]